VSIFLIPPFSLISSTIIYIYIYIYIFFFFFIWEPLTYVICRSSILMAGEFHCMRQYFSYECIDPTVLFLSLVGCLSTVWISLSSAAISKSKKTTIWVLQSVLDIFFQIQCAWWTGLETKKTKNGGDIILL
jgi:hypothetical protein